MGNARLVTFREEKLNMVENWFGRETLRRGVPLVKRHGDQKLFERVASRVRDAKTPEQRSIAFAGLTRSDDPKLIRELPGMTLDGRAKAHDVRCPIETGRPCAALAAEDRSAFDAWLGVSR